MCSFFYFLRKAYFINSYFYFDFLLCFKLNFCKYLGFFFLVYFMCIYLQIWSGFLVQGCFFCQFLFFFFKDFIFFLFLPKAPWYIVVYSSLWVLLVVACGTLPQRGLMSSAMSAPRTRTNETLGRQQRSART